MLSRAHKKLSEIGSWENSKKAAVEAELKQIEVSNLEKWKLFVEESVWMTGTFWWQEKLEKKKAEYIEKMKNKIAEIHKSAEEKKAIIEAIRGEDMLKAEETAAKWRATGTAPNKLLGCF